MQQTAKTFHHASADSDIEIVSKILAGNLANFELLMRRHNNRLYRVAMSILNDSDEARDVVQQSWVNAYNSLATFNGQNEFGSWISKITCNEALMRIRKQKSLQYVDDTFYKHVAEPEETASDPANQTASMQMNSLIEQEVCKLPMKYRSVFVLRAVQQLNTRETADSLGIEIDTVKQRYLRARRLLREGIVCHVEDSGVSIWEFAGDRCDQIVARVFAEIGMQVK